MKKINFEVVASAAANNEEVANLIKDAIETINQAHQLERSLESERVFGNNTLSIEAKVDQLYTREMIRTCYDITRYDCIEQLNDILGGNVVDMTGEDKQVCRRFYFAYRKLAAAC